MSAISALVKAGDHVLVSSSVYGPTRHFINLVPARAGVSVTYFDPNVGVGIGALFQPNTSPVFTESPGSQAFEVRDIPAICDVAHQRGAVVVMDNTWATPLFFKPFDHGLDVSVQAATKHIVGHSAISPEMALRLERWLGVAHGGRADVWLRYAGHL